MQVINNGSKHAIMSDNISALALRLFCLSRVTLFYDETLENLSAVKVFVQDKGWGAGLR